MTDKDPRQTPDPGDKMPPAPTGNASNPSAQDNDAASGENQLLGARAEKYLRESASIEDMPDDQDWQEADQTLNKDSEEQA
ncbi:hypothetical protein SAMN05444008_12318 [Cnuella takakiae]|uniref:Uncharacterized protein n=1 Tax=Cnuella takakiae TaxID=1302690 RepID=A0A1M5ID85_9BACT|nr:hypothetical protein [Cnuella takakiae]OLY90790.1 hypothetical protein BUE76_01905 [Cnuella takakiae]SHG25733.1 hypothetical protein SAMN05444008_12318 [Cnuella takakiae]